MMKIILLLHVNPPMLFIMLQPHVKYLLQEKASEHLNSRSYSVLLTLRSLLIHLAGPFSRGLHTTVRPCF